MLQEQEVKEIRENLLNGFDNLDFQAKMATLTNINLLDRVLEQDITFSVEYVKDLGLKEISKLTNTDTEKTSKFNEYVKRRKAEDKEKDLDKQKEYNLHIRTKKKNNPYSSAWLFIFLMCGLMNLTGTIQSILNKNFTLIFLNIFFTIWMFYLSYKEVKNKDNE